MVKIRSSFGNKLALAFMILTILTALTGGIGLYFTFKIFSIFEYVTAEYRPFLGNMDDIAIYLKNVIQLSEKVSQNRNVADLIELNHVFDDYGKKFTSAYSKIQEEIDRKELEEILSVLEDEHLDLTEEMNQLIRMYISELVAHHVLEEAENEMHAAAAELLSTMEKKGRSIVEGGNPQIMEGHLLLQQNIIKILDRITNFEAVQTDEITIKTLFAEGERLTEDLLEDDYLAGRYIQWQESIIGQFGILYANRDYLEVTEQIKLVDADIKAESIDAIMTLNAVVSVANIFSEEASEYNLVTVIPKILLLSISTTVLLSIVFAFFLTRNFSFPITQLLDITRSVASGDYEKIVTIKTGDELEYLGNSFNRMMKEIQTLRSNLEVKVKQRTSNLREEIKIRKRTEVDLRMSEARYKTLINNFPSGIILLVDAEHVIVAAGGQGLDIVDVLPDDIIGKGVFSFFKEIDQFDLPTLCTKAFSGEKVNMELFFAHHHWLVHTVPNVSEYSEAIDTITMLLVDVSEIKDAEKQIQQKQNQLIQADKMASLGILVAGVAHEINNPNQIIMTASQIVSKVLIDFSTFLESIFTENGDFLLGGMHYSELRENFTGYVESIRHSSERIDSIIKSLKDFSQDEPNHFVDNVNMNTVVRSSVSLLHNMIKNATENLQVHLDPSIPIIRGNPHRLEQVIINIMQNACQALLDRSRGIVISTVYDEINREILVIIKDEGNGIEEANLSKIFDPFFTTKRDIGGTGLGLSVSSSIIEEHNGYISVDSIVKEGTTLAIHLPTEEWNNE